METLKKPLRQNVALAIDGGGIRGLMVARALVVLEQATGKKITDLFRLTAGTSTGSIISAGLARGMDAQTILDLYLTIGPQIFARSWRTLPIVEYIVGYRYPDDTFRTILKDRLGDITLGELHSSRPDFFMVLTTTDLYAAETRFVKLYKKRFADWMLRDITLASCIVPTVFPVFEHEYKKEPTDPPDQDWIPAMRFWVDGGVGSYANPCYLAAYEIGFCLRDSGWDLSNTTLISVGTGISPAEKVWAQRLKGLFGIKRTPRDFLGPEWAYPSIDIFGHEADLQQIRLVRHFFTDAVAARANDPEAGLDFRRFNINFTNPIAMDDVSAIPDLLKYGERLGHMIVDNIQENVGDFACGGSIAFTF